MQYNNFEYIILNNAIQIQLLEENQRYTIPEYIDNIPVTSLSANDINTIQSLAISDNLQEVFLNEALQIENLQYYGNSDDFNSTDLNNPIFQLKAKSLNIYTLINSFGLENIPEYISTCYKDAKDALQKIWKENSDLSENASMYEVAQAMHDELNTLLTAAGLIKPSNSLIYREVKTEEMSSIIIGTYGGVEDAREIKGGYFSLTEFLIELRIPTIINDKQSSIDRQCYLNLKVNNNKALNKPIQLEESLNSTQEDKANYIVIYGKLTGDQMLIQSGGFSANGEYDSYYNVKNYTNFSIKYNDAIKQMQLYLTKNNGEIVNLPAYTFIRVWGKKESYINSL